MGERNWHFTGGRSPSAAYAATHYGPTEYEYDTKYENTIQIRKY